MDYNCSLDQGSIANNYYLQKLIVKLCWLLVSIVFPHSTFNIIIINIIHNIILLLLLLLLLLKKILLLLLYYYYMILWKCDGDIKIMINNDITTLLFLHILCINIIIIIHTHTQ